MSEAVSAAKDMVCIVCPKGCRLVTGLPVAEGGSPEGTVSVEGAGCKRGVEYAAGELRDPRRVLTSTVRTLVPARRRLAVRTSGPIPLPGLVAAARSLDLILVSGPLRAGDRIVGDWLGLGVALVAADDLEAM